MASRLEAEIARYMATRLGRPCLLTPSGRFAVYLALRTWLKAGDRVLMSPLTDDVILFIVLAAGLVPVMAPVSPEDGNIAPEAVPEHVWRSVAAVLTTNLYGLPDRMRDLRTRCDRHGVLLVEDVAHGIEIEVEGQPLGTFGAVSAFSLSKHVAVGGGILAFTDGTRLVELEARRRAAMVPTSPRQRLAGVLREPSRRMVRALRMRRTAHRVIRWLGLAERSGDRMALRSPLLREAVATGVAGGQALDRFDPWTRVDLHRYRMALSVRDLRRVLSRLGRLDEDRLRRIEGTKRLRDLDAIAPAARRGPAQPLFRVPLLLANRDEVRAELGRRGISSWYVYDPPLDDYAGPEFVEPSCSPGVARWWARHALPLDPLDADRILEACRAGHLRLEPAAATHYAEGSVI
jgi:hypothetical protein